MRSRIFFFKDYYNLMKKMNNTNNYVIVNLNIPFNLIYISFKYLTVKINLLLLLLIVALNRI